MDIWFSRKFNGVKKHCSKSLSIRFAPQHWRMVKVFTNGAQRGRKEDTCFSLNVYFLGVFFSYVNWDFNR